MPELSGPGWASSCARCGKSIDDDAEKTINDEPALIHWSPLGGGPDKDPTRVICPSCQGMKYDDV
jgi:hypothetical protein